MLTSIRFSAPWCQPCKVSGPIFRNFVNENQIPTEEVDIDADPATAEEFGIQSVPTVIFQRDGEEVARLIGPKTSAQLKAAYETL